jgi:hypothetical protein
MTKSGDGIGFPFRRDPEEGRVCFDDWEDLNEYEKLAIKTFEEGLENAFELQPPAIYVQYRDGDVVLALSLCALGTQGCPRWDFSLKQALSNIEWSDEEKLKMVQALIALAEHVRAQVISLSERERAQ